jgi:hypothetical protein
MSEIVPFPGGAPMNLVAQAVEHDEARRAALDGALQTGLATLGDAEAALRAIARADAAVPPAAIHQLGVALAALESARRAAQSAGRSIQAPQRRQD